MLNRLLWRIWGAVHDDVHTDAVSVGRALVLVSGAGTLLLGGGARTLLAPHWSPGADGSALEAWQSVQCGGLRQALATCVVPADLLPAAHVAMGLLLLVAAVGFRPRWTCIPAWWVLWTNANTFAFRDGGDFLAAVVALLLVPIGLTDGRRLAWRRFGRPSPPSLTGRLLGRTSLALAAAQMAMVYFQAAVVKLHVPAWQAGTAMHHWLGDPVFGARVGGSELLELLRHPLPLALLTWSPIVVEAALALGVLLDRRRRRWLLVAGVPLHLSIWALMGLANLSLAMVGGLVLYAWPLGARRPEAPPGPPDPQRIEEEITTTLNGRTSRADGGSTVPAPDPAAPPPDDGDRTADVHHRQPDPARDAHLG